MVSAIHRLNEILVTEAATVFETAGLSIREVDNCAPPEGEEMVLCIIGFGGSTMRGAIVLLARRDVWQAMLPPALEPSSTSRSLLCDMAGEMLNMVIGRFRNRLLRRDVEIQCGTPTTAYGSLDLPCLPSNAALHVARHCFDTGVGCIHSRVDVLFRDGFEFPESDCGVEPNDAELLFF